jgi:hypothetical protein
MIRQAACGKFCSTLFYAWPIKTKNACKGRWHKADTRMSCTACFCRAGQAENKTILRVLKCEPRTRGVASDPAVLIFTPKWLWRADPIVVGCKNVKVLQLSGERGGFGGVIHEHSFSFLFIFLLFLGVFHALLHFKPSWRHLLYLLSLA